MSKSNIEEANKILARFQKRKKQKANQNGMPGQPKDIPNPKNKPSTKFLSIRNRTIWK